MIKPIKHLAKKVSRFMPAFMKTSWFMGGTLVLVLGISGYFGQSYYYKTLNNKYIFSQAEQKLISKSTVDKNFIKESAKEISYSKTEETKSTNFPSQIIIKTPDATTKKSPYSVKLSKDPKDGITFGDDKSERNVTIKSLANLSSGRLDQGNVVYPVSANEKHVYSFKANGLKEDILLTKPTAKVMNYSWQLDTGKELEARIMSDGGVGIYSANPVFFGDISIGDDKSQKLIENARKVGKKDHLVYTIPKPYIVDAKGAKSYDDVSYKLSGNTLTLTALNMVNKNYPLTIDPTITVTSTAEFRTGYGADDNIDYATTSGTISRALGHTGELDTRTATTVLAPSGTCGRSRYPAVAYNGYFYVIGGMLTSGSLTNTVCYSAIDSAGVLGAWATTTSFINIRERFSAVAYNGYMYVLGGDSVGSFYNDVQYAAIASNGTIGAWHYTDSDLDRSTTFNAGFTTARSNHTSVVYNGFLYVIGGLSSGGNLTSVQYAHVNADGTVGSWSAASSLPATRLGHSSVQYNGYIYVIAGQVSGIVSTSVYYSAIAADGSLGTWTATTSISIAARTGAAAGVYGGYLYIGSGYDAASADFTDMAFAGLNSDGTVGEWRVSAQSIGTARDSCGSLAYNGYFYCVGGETAAASVLTSGSYFNLENGIINSTFVSSTPTSIPNTRFLFSSVAYNGFLYILGGCDTATDVYTCSAFLATVHYTTINSDGSTGSWTASTAFTTARYGHTSVVYNGRVYVIGGCSANAGNVCTTFKSDIQYATLAGGGGITGGWTTNGTSFTTARHSHTSEVYNGKLYVIGGNTGSADTGVQFATINSGGDVGSWTATTAFTTARWGHGSAAYHGYLYVVAGRNGATYYSTAQYAPINADGTIGSWTATNSITNAGYGYAVVAWNDQLYAAGGTDGVTIFGDITHAKIKANGSLDTWSTPQSVTTRYNNTLVAYNGYLYVIGGCQTNFVCSSQASYVYRGYVSMTNPVSMQIARYERVIDTGLGNNPKSIIINGVACGSYTVKYRGAATSDSIFGTTTSTTATPGVSFNISVPAKRYLFLAITMNDSSCTAQSSITDIIVTYTGPPNPPTLSLPTNGATNVPVQPEFRLGSTETYADYLQYKIEVFTGGSCLSILRTIDQSSSQTGWLGQSQLAGTGYVGGPTILENAIHQYQSPSLSGSTLYSWRAYAIAPTGSNYFSTASSCNTFTTDIQTPSRVLIKGGVKTNGGIIIK